jgi:hypothetical protein
MPTRDELMQALRSADAAGDAAAAQAIARRLDSMRSAPGFSDVTSTSSPTVPKKSAGRVVGLVARSIGQGLGGLADFGRKLTPLGQIEDAVREYAPGLLPGDAPNFRGAAAKGLDMAGAPVANTPGERIGSDIGEAVTGTVATMGTGAAAGIPKLAAGPLRQIISAAAGSGAASATRESGGGQGAQLAAGIAGGLAPSGIPAAGAGIARFLARGGETGRQAMVRDIQTFEHAGTSPTLGQVSPSAIYAEAGLRNVPGGARVIRRKLESQDAELGQATEALANRLSPASGAEKGGRALVSGITGPNGFMNRFKAESANLYAKVDQFIPKNLPVPATATQRALSQLTTPIQGAANTSKVLMSSKVGSIAQAFTDDLAAGNGQLSYDAMKRLRSQVGELIGDSAMSPDTPTRQLKMLYGAMSEDLTQAAIATGNPQAISAARRASKHYKFGEKRIEAIEQVIDRSGGPEAVYRAMFANSREGGTTLRKVMQSLDGPAQRDLAAVTLRRIGKANPSAQDDIGETFSSATFLTNWNKIAPEAKRALFDRFGAGFRDDLDAIAATTSKMRDAAQVLPNPSGTAPAAAQATAYGTIATSLATGNPGVAASVVGGIGAANVFARAFTNPKTVKWLAQQTRLPPGALPAQLSILAQIGRTDPDAAELHQQLTKASP